MAYSSIVKNSGVAYKMQRHDKSEKDTSAKAQTSLVVEKDNCKRFLVPGIPKADT